ncbi:MAG: biotin transporter BioY [Candidatus Omnitrophota bacterium]|nr:MAG: biotin transporter BioY [Candidatus Omnitrophota bacterium]
MKTVSYSRSRSQSSTILLILTFTFLMVISAHIRIPLFFTPVPITMQTLVLFLNILLLKNKAYFSQLIYIFLGVAGLPVFCKGGAGLLYLLGPTGGYLLGFLAAAVILPFFMRDAASAVKNFLVCIFAIIIVYSLGVSWLLLFHKFSFVAAVCAGVFPFITGDVFKAVLATGISSKLFGGRFGRLF